MIAQALRGISTIQLLLAPPGTGLRLRGRIRYEQSHWHHPNRGTGITRCRDV
jgi:hypothetical protein